MRKTTESETTIFVTDHGGCEHALAALDGWRVMEVIRDWGIEVAAECGGAGLCGTCHVYVDEQWLERLEPPAEDELTQLDAAQDAGSSSRLCCQILTSEKTDGLRLRLAPGSERKQP